MDAFPYLSVDMIRIQHIPTLHAILHKQVIEAMLPQNAAPRPAQFVCRAVAIGISISIHIQPLFLQAADMGSIFVRVEISTDKRGLLISRFTYPISQTI
jgi:hypothetical protein